jgi:hypothetical protein
MSPTSSILVGLGGFASYDLCPCRTGS